MTERWLTPEELVRKKQRNQKILASLFFAGIIVITALITIAAGKL